MVQYRIWVRSYVVSVALILTLCAPAQADYFTDVGYALLREELGLALPVAAGVPVMLVEANKGADPGALAYAPNVANAEFRGKRITVGEGGPLVYAPYSGHATGVGRRFFGLRLSVSPGIDQIASYWADNWFGAAFLRLGGVRPPKAPVSRVASHAWVGSTTRNVTGLRNAEALRRVDWLAERDELFHVVGFNGGDKSPLLADAFNVLSVAHTGFDKHRTTLALDADYVAGRPRPHLVVPEKTPSAATGRVASVAALLIGVGHANPSLSHGETKNRRGDKIYNAERSVVIKAALLAGAERTTGNSTGVDIDGYLAVPAERTSNGLDRRYGSGQLSVYNSYQILLAGEQDSAEDQVSDGKIGLVGFDHDESFGGADNSNDQATYRFSTGSSGGQLTVSLVWNIDIHGGSPLKFDASAILYDLDLVLYTVSGEKRIRKVASRSNRDNSENIHIGLAAEADYELTIQPGINQSPFDWSYGLAWRFVANNN